MIRVRFGNNVPMVLERSYFPCDRFPGLEELDVVHRSVFQILRDHYGVPFGTMRQTLEPVAANEFEAEVLNVSKGSPVMLVWRRTFDIHERPVEYAKDVFRGDRSSFVSEADLSDWAGAASRSPGGDG